MVLEAVLLAQLVGTMQECTSPNGMKYYSTTAMGCEWPMTSTTTTMSLAKCEDGWTMILALSGYKCARELKDPR